MGGAAIHFGVNLEVSAGQEAFCSGVQVNDRTSTIRLTLTDVGTKYPSLWMALYDELGRFVSMEKQSLSRQDNQYGFTVRPYMPKGYFYRLFLTDGMGTMQPVAESYSGRARVGG